ncbi:c6 transcription [Moniliophthora roreri MCA 2997]|uniref:C6 transcription n=2 Tax=Moniliophthora roreri TaxID=221103 RepID=V2WSB0_MONRO|nr:c6 transcription [Moniliophthora roreri MCA 2997]KAI3621553.1 c6 transcription [Moniliophthora roreri]
MSAADDAATFELEGVIRFHAKSRRGCLTCRRRIKCDETRPTCRNCYQRNLECVQRPKNEHNQERRQQQQQQVMLYKPLSAPTPIPIDVTSLRIMHHFTIATSASFLSDPTATRTFCITVPQLSWNNPQVLHALLSCTALHLGRLYPKDSKPNWLYRASVHRKAAIAAPPGAMNPDAQFLILGFFSIYTISSSLFSSPENIFSLITSLHNVWSTWSAMEAPHMYGNQRLKDLDPFLMNLQPDSGMKALAQLQQIYDFSTPGFELESEELFDPSIREAYRLAVEALYVAYPFSRTGLEAKSAVTWPAYFGKKFRDLLNERRQRALVVLYYYLGMLRGMSERCWWANEVPRCQEYVYGLLDNKWRDWLLDVCITINPVPMSAKNLTY